MPGAPGDAAARDAAARDGAARDGAAGDAARDAGAGDAARDGAAGDTAAPARPAVIVEDHQLSRIRRPADLLRFVAGCVGIALLVAAGLLAKATVTGVETDVVKASGLLHAILGTLRVLAVLALVLLPVALAIRQLVRRQARRLAEAVVTGVLAGLFVALADVLLRTGTAEPLYRAIAPAAAQRQQLRPAGRPAGRPDRVHDDHRPERTAALAGGAVGVGHRLRGRQPGRPAHHGPVRAHHAAAGLGPGPGRAVRRGLDVAAPPGRGHRRRARRGRRSR